MANPWETLGVAPEADEATVRRRYLELVRQNPPEKCPERFAEIRKAYEELSDPMERLSRQLLEPRQAQSFDETLAELRSRLQTERIPTEVLLSLARR